jgi:hypothetical protein
LATSDNSNVHFNSISIFLADFGHIHGIDWKNLVSNVLIASFSSSLGIAAIWKAVFGHTQFTLRISSKDIFCSAVSNAKYTVVLLFSS